MRITVHGAAQAEVAPDFGRLHGEVRAHDADKAEALRRVTDATRTLTEAFAALRGSGAVLKTVVRPMTISSYQPYGDQGALEHSATVTWWADFPSSEGLGAFGERYGSVDAVQLGSTEWLLHDETRRRVEAECLTHAVGQARERASAIAAAAGAGEVSFVEITDAGLQGPVGQPMLRAMAAGGMERGVEISTDDVVIGVELVAVFDA